MNFSNSLLIELPLGNTAQVMFGDQPNLRGKNILTLLPTPASAPGGGTVYALAGVALANLLAGATVTLKTAANKDIHVQLPLRYLYEGAAAGHPIQLGKEPIDWAKSFITVPPGSAGAGTVIQVAVIYE
jgi:hypothetical protein